MAAPTRTAEQRELDLIQVTELYLRGHTQADIAARLGVSRQQVTYDLKALHERWRAAQFATMTEAKARELDKIDALEAEAWEAWRRSVGKKTKERMKLSGDGDSLEELSWEDAGDPRFLERVSWCITKRCEIFGLDAPKKIAPTDPTGEKPYRVAVSECTDEQLRTIAQLKRIATGDQCQTN